MKRREPQPQPAYAWLSGEQALRHALAAYYLACRRADRAAADFPDDQADPESRALARVAFADQLAEAFRLRLHEHGNRAGMRGFDSHSGELLVRQFGRSTRASVAQRLAVNSTEDIHWHL